MTVIKFGIVRNGPCAPLAFQFGKYERRTTTGTPGVLVRKLIEFRVWRMFEIVVVGSDGCTALSATGFVLGVVQGLLHWQEKAAWIWSPGFELKRYWRVEPQSMH